MASIQDIMAENHVTQEMVFEWAKTIYPNYKNLGTLSKVYLLQHGITLVPPARPSAPEVEIAKLEVGKYAVIRGILIQELQSAPYRGCSKCFTSESKLSEKLCFRSNPEHGVVEDLIWRTFLIGDNSGEVICFFSPMITKEYTLSEGFEIATQGSLNDRGEFAGFRMISAERPKGIPSPAEASKLATPPIKVGLPSVPEVKTIPEGRVICPHCKHDYKSAGILKLHIRKDHKDVQVSTGVISSQAPSVATQTETPLNPPPQIVTPPLVVSQVGDSQSQEPMTGILLEATRMTKVFGMLKKTKEEFSQNVLSKFPNLDVTSLLDASGVAIGSDQRLYVKSGK